MNDTAPPRNIALSIRLDAQTHERLLALVQLLDGGMNSVTPSHVVRYAIDKLYESSALGRRSA
jgi:hypothetical protein